MGAAETERPPVYLRCSASLRLFGQLGDFDELARRLGQVSTQSYRRGERVFGHRHPTLNRVHEQDGWIFTAPLPEELPLDDHASALVNAFMGREEVLADLASHMRAEIYLSVASNSDIRTFELSAETTSGLARLNLPLSFSAFAWDWDVPPQT